LTIFKERTCWANKATVRSRNQREECHSWYKLHVRTKKWSYFGWDGIPNFYHNCLYDDN